MRENKCEHKCARVLCDITTKQRIDNGINVDKAVILKFQMLGQVFGSSYVNYGNTIL